MSTYRNTSRFRHSDERLVNVSPIAKHVWDYLCCNRQDDASGLYRLSIATTSEDLGWTPEQIEGALQELCFEKLIERDEKLRLVWVRNMLKRSYPRPSTTQRESVERYLASMPRTVLVRRLVDYYSERYGLDLDVQDRTPDTPPPTLRSEAQDPLREGVQSVSVSVEGSESDRDPPRARASKRRPLRAESEDDLPAGLVDAVLVAMREAVQSVTRGRDRGPQDSPGNRDLIRTCTRREQATIEHWRHVIAAQAESVRGNPDTWRYLALSTITRRNNWLRLLDAPAGRRSNRGPIDPSTQDHDAPPEF